MEPTGMDRRCAWCSTTPTDRPGRWFKLGDNAGWLCPDCDPRDDKCFEPCALA